MVNFPRWKIILIALICFVAIIIAMPNFLSSKNLESLPNWLPKNTMNLGLDLKGGSHLLLEVDFDSYYKDHLENLKDSVRRDLREEKIGYINLSANKASVSFSLRSKESSKKVEKLFKKNKDLELSLGEDAYSIKYTQYYLELVTV